MRILIRLIFAISHRGLYLSGSFLDPSGRESGLRRRRMTRDPQILIAQPPMKMKVGVKKKKKTMMMMRRKRRGKVRMMKKANPSLQ